MPKRSLSGDVNKPALVVAPTKVNGGKSSLIDRAAGLEAAWRTGLCAGADGHPDAGDGWPYSHPGDQTAGGRREDTGAADHRAHRQCLCRGSATLPGSRDGRLPGKAAEPRSAARGSRSLFFVRRARCYVYRARQRSENPRHGSLVSRAHSAHWGTRSMLIDPVVGIPPGPLGSPREQATPRGMHKHVACRQVG